MYDYSIGGVLYHSAKGVDWKNHKYIDKVKKAGKWVYTYARNTAGYKRNKQLAKRHAEASDKARIQVNNAQNRSYANKADRDSKMKQLNRLINESTEYNAAIKNQEKKVDKAQEKLYNSNTVAFNESMSGSEHAIKAAEYERKTKESIQGKAESIKKALSEIPGAIQALNDSARKKATEMFYDAEYSLSKVTEYINENLPKDKKDLSITITLK